MDKEKLDKYIQFYCDNYNKLGGYYRYGICEDIIKNFGDNLLNNSKYIINIIKSKYVINIIKEYKDHIRITYTLFENFYQITNNKEYLMKLLIFGGKDSIKYRELMIDMDYIDNDRILEAYQKLYEEFETHKKYMPYGEGYYKAKEHFEDLQ